MKIVIDLSGEEYTDCLNYVVDKDNCYPYSDFNLREIIRNGQVLPKGHGKLIDGDLLNRNMYHTAFETDTDLQKWDSGCWIRYKMFENIMAETPTIIEGDNT